MEMVCVCGDEHRRTRLPQPTLTTRVNKKRPKSGTNKNGKHTDKYTFTIDELVVFQENN